MIKTFLASLLIVSSFAIANEEAIRVDGLVDSNEVGVGDQFTFTVEITSKSEIAADEPQIPAIDGARVLNVSTSSSTSTNMVRGQGGWEFKSVRKVAYTYLMIATKKGNIKIPPFTVNVGGKSYATKAVDMKAVEGVAANRGRGRPNQQAQGGLPPNVDDLLDDPEELFNQMLRQRFGNRGIPPGFGGGSQMGNIQPPKNPNELLTIQVEADKREVYEGEQITVNWYILSRGNLLSLDRTKFPDLKGFWKEIIEEVPALHFQQEVLNGQVYRRALLASHALFPIKEGTATIDEFKIKGQVQVPGVMSGPAYSFNRSSERLSIKVLPLPKEGRPKDFTGAVGQFNVQAIIDNNILPVNQPFSLKIRFEGSGNAKLIEMPGIEWPPSLEVYETKSESKFFKNGQSYKQFEVMLIPRQTGDIQTPPISVSLFDPQKKSFYTRTIEPISLKVLQGSDPGVIGSKRIEDKKDVAVQKPTMPAPIAVMESSSFGGSGMTMLGLLYLGIFAGLGAFGYTQLSDRNVKKDLNKVIKNRIRQAEGFVSAGDHRKVGVTMVNLISEVLGEVSGQKGSDREMNKMLELSPPSVRRNLGPAILKLVDAFQTLSFAPEEYLAGLKSKESLTNLVNEARKTLDQVVVEAATSKE